MRVLVTGHKGYIGTVLVPMLLETEHDVVGLDSDLYRHCTFGDDGKICKIPELRKDVRDVEKADLDGFEAVIHLAGFSNDPLGDMNPELTYEINHAASVHLARLAKEVGLSIAGRKCTTRLRQECTTYFRPNCTTHHREGSSIELASGV